MQTGVVLSVGGGSLNLLPFERPPSQTLRDQMFADARTFPALKLGNTRDCLVCRNKRCNFLRDFGGAARI